MRSCLIRLYRLLLHLQPAEVRRRYGMEMIALMDARAVDDGSASFWLRELADVIVSAVRARRSAFGWTLVLAAIAHATYAIAVYPESAMGIGAVLLTGGSLMAGLVMTRFPRRFVQS